MAADNGIASLISGLRVSVTPVMGIGGPEPAAPIFPQHQGSVTTESAQWAPVGGSRAIFSAIKTAAGDDLPPLPPQQPQQPQPPRPTLVPEPAKEEAPLVEISSPVALPLAVAGLARLHQMLNEAGVKPGTKEFNFDLADRLLHPMVLDILFTAFFSEEWYDWESETLDNSVNEIAAMGGGEISAVNLSKIKAMQVLHSTTYPWVSMMPFTKTSIALDGRIPDSEILEPVHPGTMMCALAVMRRIKPQQALSHEVLRFIAASCLHDGLMIFPDVAEGPMVNQVLARLCEKSVSRSEYAALEGLWKRFAESGGPQEIMSRDLDDVDESNLGDYQFAMAARTLAYAAEYEDRMAEQFSALALWAAQAGAA